MPGNAQRVFAVGLDLRDIRRMMGGYDERTLEIVGLHSFQRSFEKIQLRVAQVGKLVALRRDNPGILQAIAIKAENAHSAAEPQPKATLSRRVGVSAYRRVGVSW